MGTGGSYPGSKAADHLLPSSARVKNAWSYISTSWYVFMVWCLVKKNDNFTLLYLYLYALGNLDMQFLTNILPQLP
jgi:hypothetical protein